MRTIPKHVVHLLKEMSKESTKHPLKKVEVWITIFFGLFAGYQAWFISQQSQRIEGFDSLIRKVDTQTQKLSAQLSISQDIQSRSNQIYEIKLSTDASKLLAAVNSITAIMSDIEIVVKEESHLKVKDYLSLVQEIMKEQLDNTFLMENSAIANNWVRIEILLGKTKTHTDQQYHIGRPLLNRDVYDSFMPSLKQCINSTKQYCNHYLK